MTIVKVTILYQDVLSRKVHGSSVLILPALDGDTVIMGFDMCVLDDDICRGIDIDTVATGDVVFCADLYAVNGETTGE